MSVVDAAEIHKVAQFESSACAADGILDEATQLLETLSEASTSGATSDLAAQKLLDRADALFAQALISSNLSFVPGKFPSSELSNSIGRVYILRKVRPCDLTVAGIPRVVAWDMGRVLRFVVLLSDAFPTEQPGDLEKTLELMAMGIRVTATLRAPPCITSDPSLGGLSSEHLAPVAPLPLPMPSFAPDPARRCVVVSIPLTATDYKPQIGSFVDISRVEFAGVVLPINPGAACILAVVNHDEPDVSTSKSAGTSESAVPSRDSELNDAVMRGDDVEGVIHALASGASIEMRNKSVSCTAQGYTSSSSSPPPCRPLLSSQ